MNEVSLVLKSVSILIPSLKDAQKEHANKGTIELHIFSHLLHSNTSLSGK